MKQLTILIVDDNVTIRAGIKLTLNSSGYIIECDEAENGLEAVEFSKKTNYDIILMDISMPLMDGIEATKKIVEIKPKQKIIMVSMHSTKDEIEHLKEIGAKGYILKEDVNERLTETIDKVIDGKYVFDLTYY